MIIAVKLNEITTSCKYVLYINEQKNIFRGCKVNALGICSFVISDLESFLLFVFISQFFSTGYTFGSVGV